MEYIIYFILGTIFYVFITYFAVKTAITATIQKDFRAFWKEVIAKMEK